MQQWFSRNLVTTATSIMCETASGTPDSARWELFAHGADIGVRGFGPTAAAAFAAAAVAMTAAVTDPRGVRPHEAIEIECQAPDLELLFYEWLNALVFEMAVRRMLFGKFTARIEDGRLTGTAWGEPVDPARHEPAVEVKGATLTQLHVGADAGGQWTAQCIVDV